MKVRLSLPLLIGFIVLVTAGVAVAQTIGASKEALDEAKRQSTLADARAAQFEAGAQRAEDDAGRARAQQAAVAARIQSAEAEIAAGEARIRIIEALRTRQRAKLAAKQGPIVRLTAALQIMARRPAALAMVQPGSINDLVHVRSLLASRVPLIQERTAGLRAEVERGAKLRQQADQAVALLRQGQNRLESERTALVRLEAQHRVRSQALVDSAMHEQDRAIALGEEAKDIVDLMDQLDKQATVRDRLAELPGPLLRPPVPGRFAALPPGATPARSDRIAYRLPVIGRVVTGLGEVSDAGVRARGLTIATRPQAQVVAPSAGRIAYAGPFRGYGEVIIVDHGGGWTTLITHLATLAVAVGDTVDPGSPLGRAGPGRSTVTVELRRDGQPVDITPMISS